MNDLKIAYFLAVAETLSFTKAAEKMYVSQPVISRQIAAVEKEVQLTLFSRDNKTVSLTAAGQVFYDGLKDLGRQYASLLRKASAVEKGYSGTVEIGALAGQMVRDFSPILQSFEKRYTDIKVSLEAYGLMELRQRLLSRQLDFVLGAGADFDYFPNFALETVAKAKICVVLSTLHRHYGRAADTLGLSDFREDTFITLSESESPVNTRRFYELCSKSGFLPKQIEAKDLGTLMLLLETEHGISTLDETHVFSSNPHLRFIPLPELGYTKLSVIWNKENANPCIGTFIEHLKNYG
jgi:DNA-binding transcriptional LysR family regulator